MVKHNPTSYSDINDILNLLLPRVKETLGSQFIGMYLFGSLANGGFDRDSDIDVLVVTTDELSEGIFSKLAKMHRQFSKIDSPWATQIEVSYIPKEAIRRFDPENMCHPHLDRGSTEKLYR